VSLNNKQEGTMIEWNPKISDDLEWVEDRDERGRRHWILCKDGNPFDGELEDFVEC
jgi:hypothetical protein